MNKYCLIGNPVKHSLSPDIFNYLCSKYGFKGSYFLEEIEKNSNKYDIYRQLIENYNGANITMPFKNALFDVLHTVNPISLDAFAINTVLVRGKKLLGFNTDILGLRNLLFTIKDIITNSKILIIGTGATARSTLVCFLKFFCISEVNFYTRDKEGIDEAVYSRLKSKYRKDFKLFQPGEEISEFDILINASPMGMKDVLYDSINSEIWNSSGKLLIDWVYSNSGETHFISKLKENYDFCFEGLDLLISQAVESFKLWSKIEINVDTGLILEIKSYLQNQKIERTTYE